MLNYSVAELRFNTKKCRQLKYDIKICYAPAAVKHDPKNRNISRHLYFELNSIRHHFIHFVRTTALFITKYK